MSFRYLDMEHYERIEHFRYFLSMPYPYAGVTVDIDVTDIVSFCKARESFYLTFLHAAARPADRVPEPAAASMTASSSNTIPVRRRTRSLRRRDILLLHAAPR